MSDRDLSDLGREIEEKIKNFVDSQEMKDLQENIHIAVDNTMKEMRRSVKNSADYINKNVNARWENQQKEDPPKSQAGPGNIPPDRNIPRYIRRRLPVVKKPPGRILGAFLTFIGSCGAAVTWAVILAGLGMTILGKDILGGMYETLLGMAFIGPFLSGLTSFGMISFGLAVIVAAGFMAVDIVGGIMRRRAVRFKNYMYTIGTKELYSIEELAQSTGKSERYTIRDLKKMVRRRWFREGHFDDEETCFMLTDEAYQDYLNQQAKLKRQQEEEERQRKEQEILEHDPVRKQLQITIEEGKEYIRRIRDVNIQIPGEDISRKLYRLERICTRIFECIEEKPELLVDTRKFMNYYLPTTLKLVETYYEFSIQPVRGENITTAQREIEDMLDHINQAFEKMFDRLFEDSAMDISTDISVLSTMFAQEGLLDSEFKQ